jgi:hypothetical protein
MYIGIVVSLLTLSGSLGESVRAAEPRTMVDYVREYGGGANMNVPIDPLRPADLDRWSDILNASEAQQQFMRIEYQAFVDAHNAYLDREAPRYLGMTVEFWDVVQAEGLSSWALVEIMRKLDQASDRVRRELTAIELEMIDKLAPILTEEQIERLDILRLESRRRNCRTFISFGRWADVELRLVWDASGRPAASPAELERAETILLDYERQLTPLICRQSELEFRTRQDLLQNRINRNEGTVTFEEGTTRYIQIQNRRGDAARDVRLLHERTTDHIAAVVSDEVAASFITAAKEVAYPELYPDPTDLKLLISTVQNDLSPEDATFGVLQELWNRYSVEYERTCNDLESLCVKWGDKASRGVSGYQIQFLPEALKPLLAERIELSRRYLTKLHEHLGPEVLERHADAIPAVFRSILADGDEAEVADEVERTAP